MSADGRGDREEKNYTYGGKLIGNRTSKSDSSLCSYRIELCLEARVRGVEEVESYRPCRPEEDLTTTGLKEHHFARGAQGCGIDEHLLRASHNTMADLLWKNHDDCRRREWRKVLVMSWRSTSSGMAGPMMDMISCYPGPQAKSDLGPAFNSAVFGGREDLCEEAKPLNLAGLEAISTGKNKLLVHAADHTSCTRSVFWLEGACRWINRQMIHCLWLSCLEKAVFPMPSGLERRILGPCYRGESWGSETRQKQSWNWQTAA